LMEADNGEGGIEAARSVQPDCIVLDDQLPDMEGADVLAALAGPGGVMPCAVVMLTGSSNGTTAARLLSAGALDYLSKIRLDDESLRRAINGSVDRFRLMAAQRASEARNAQLAAIVAASNDAIISFGHDRSVLTWNTGAVELFGYSEAQAVGRSIDELIVSDDMQAESRQIFDAIKEGKEFARFETERQHMDGTRVPVDVTVSPMLDGQGTLRGFSVVFRDITQRRDAEKALRDREHELAQAQRIGRIGGYRIELRDGKIIAHRSPEYLAIHGLPPDTQDETHAEWVARIHPDDRHRVNVTFLGAIERQTDFSFEYRIIRPSDGEVRWLSAIGEVERDSLGRMVGVTGVHADITERYLAARALREREAELAQAQRIGRLGSFRAEIRNGIVAATRSPEFLRIHGLPPEATNETHESWKKRIHPDDFDRVVGAFWEAVETRSNYTVEYRIVRADNGESRWVSNSIEFEPDAPGGVVRLFGTHTDITERKRAEERIRLAQVAGEIGLFERDFVAKVTRWSPEIRRLYGYDDEGAAELAFDYAFEHHIHPNDKPAHDANRQAFMASPERHFNFEFRIIRKDGEVRWILARGEMQRDADGRPLVAMGINMDITKRKRMEQALAASEAYNRRLLEASPDCVKVIDLEGRVQQMNCNGQCVMEIDDFEMVRGRPWHELWPEVSRAHIATAIRDALAGGTGRFVGFCPTAKGTPKWWDVAVNTVPGADGKPVALLAASRDITEIRRSQEQIELLVREVTHRSKNLLGVVQAIARQTVTHSTLETFGKSFADRINALASSHDLLVQSDWAGVDLADLVRSQLTPFQGDLEKQIRVQGPKLRISAAAAQSIGMAVHELATNAVKYGALSQDDGQVEIEWSARGAPADRTFSMSWSERNGPPVTPPTRRGFGTTVVDYLVKSSLDAQVVLEYAPSGVVWRIECAAGRILEA
jgi:PAS domain S-box-containing protein